MVGGNYVDASVGQCLTQCCTIFRSLDSRVALYVCAKCVVVFSSKHQVGNDGLCCYLLLC